MHQLHIDLETYCVISLPSAGLYRYAEDPTFQILLFGYSLDGGPVEVIDLMNGEPIPDEIIALLHDENTLVYAFNAAFEYTILNAFFGPLDITRWRDVMVHAYYCGCAGGLALVGEMLGLPSEKKKDKIGSDLIRFFSKPVEPKKSNGFRTRNFPWHDPEKWALYKSYNARDVVAEMAIEERLKNQPVPAFVWQQWFTDMAINARGIAVDLPFVEWALRINEKKIDALTREAIRITELENPNSGTQLISWLTKNTDLEIKSLAKDDVSSYLTLMKAENDQNPDAIRVLEIRQEMARTSVKKYEAIKACVCHDERIRGTIQFYGSRTGRWAGRLVQVQNLPRTYIEDVEKAKSLVMQGDMEGLESEFGSVTDTLSQLIRTSLISDSDKILVDVDFSAIEARVLSWLAEESWRLEVFRTHGKIYEAAASKMFSVPVERITKGNPEYSYRAKGKIAELALGYGGSVRALKAMGADKMGLTDAELHEIVRKWRASNRQIVKLWYDVDEAVRDCISNSTSAHVGKCYFQRLTDVDCGGVTFLTITLPSKRKLYYQNPWVDGSGITFQGLDNGTKKYGRVRTFGGRLVENITQAVARDCLAEAIERLTKQGAKIVFHVHDEVIIEAEKKRPANEILAAVETIMKVPPSWAQDLPLNAAGWTGTYFRKD